jgi:metal-dependent amidase/aminoacylase/carboxypeptidase family protein
MDRDLRQARGETAAAVGLEVEVKEFWYFPPTPFHPDLVSAVRDAAAAQGYPQQDIISGAGHDAVYMARVAPTAMVFVPCVGGISHNEIEDAKPEDLTAGCNVLLNAVLGRANAALPVAPSFPAVRPCAGLPRTGRLFPARTLSRKWMPSTRQPSNRAEDRASG